MEKKSTLAKTNLKKNTQVKEKPLKVSIYDKTGKVVGSLSLPKEIFGQKPNNNLISQAIRIYLDHKKSSTASTKTRSEVSGGGRKPWRQKGTGRARAGTIRAPHWRGGGVVFGPKPTASNLKLPKKMRQKALAVALSDKYLDEVITIVDKIDFKEPKTKKAQNILTRLPIKENRNILLILEKEMSQTSKSFRNLNNVSISKAVDINTLDVVRSSSLILTKESLEGLKNRFSHEHEKLQDN